jgi:hypothetical protein
VITVGVALLLLVAVYAGLRLTFPGVAGYLAAVGVTLAIWGMTWVLRGSYAAALPLILGMAASLFLGIAGFRAAARSGTPLPWVIGAVLALTPLAAVLVRWLTRWSGSNP